MGLLILLAGCSNLDLGQISEDDINKVIVCEEPYIRHGAGCCLDINQNKICDNDDQAIEEQNTVKSTTQIETNTEIEIKEPSANTEVKAEIESETEEIADSDKDSLSKLLSYPVPEVKLIQIYIENNGHESLSTEDVLKISGMVNEDSKLEPSQMTLQLVINGDSSYHRFWDEADQEGFKISINHEEITDSGYLFKDKDIFTMEINLPQELELEGNINAYIGARNGGSDHAVFTINRIFEGTMYVYP